MTVTIFCIMIKYGTDISDTTLAILNLFMDLIITVMLVYMFRPSVESIKILACDAVKKIKCKEFITIIILKGLVTIGGGKLLLDLFYILDENFVNSFISDMIVEINGPVAYIIESIILCALCPIIDELIFRSVVFKRIAKRFNAYIGIIISSIVFAAVNIGNGIIGAFICGIINCIIYIKYKNIFMPILINLGYNILNCIMLIPFVNKNLETLFVTTSNLINNLCIGILMLFVGLILFLRFYVKNRKCINEYDKELKESLKVYSI